MNAESHTPDEAIRRDHIVDFLTGQGTAHPRPLAEAEQIADRFIAAIRLEAQCEALQDAQQIVAGERMVDEARGRNRDRISVGHTIRELDAEIRQSVVGGKEQS